MATPVVSTWSAGSIHWDSDDSLNILAATALDGGASNCWVLTIHPRFSATDVTYSDAARLSVLRR